jgi:predicted metal-dependent hydrolase
MQGDRAKAYRPIPEDRRREALEDGIAAFERGDFFQAHELLEPAWMGTADLAERALYQGLIKLAAGYVHAVRGNPIGMTRNLEGARKHLTTSIERDPSWGASAGIDLDRLLLEVNVRLASARSNWRRRRRGFVEAVTAVPGPTTPPSPPRPLPPAGAA